MGRRPSKRAAATARERAVQLLALRDRTAQEVLRRLAREGWPEEDSKAAVEALRGRGLLDDAATAGRYARSRLLHSGYGTRRIRAGLRARGVKEADAGRGLQDALAEVPEAEALEAVVARRWKPAAGADRAEALRRLAGFLLRRGFPPGLVFARLRSLAPGADEALAGIEDESEPVDPAEREDR